MTEDYWQKYKKNKDKSSNTLFGEVESEMKRRFKNEKTPDDMLLLCKTDNNFWKQYRMSENLDDDSVALSLCKTVGCELMYCQALTFSKKAQFKEIETYGCSEQYSMFRDCYLKEKRRFNVLVKEDDWKNDPQVIPEYIKKQLALAKINTDMKIAKEVSEKVTLEASQDLSNEMKQMTQISQQKLLEQKSNPIGIKNDGYL